MTKKPAKQQFKVKHKQTEVRYTFVCVHDPKSSKYGFANIARPFAKLLSPTEMDIHFDEVLN
jgi:hypothetical protein